MNVCPTCARKHVISTMHAREEYRMREMQEPCQPGKQTGLYNGQTDLYNEQTSLYGIPPAPLIQTGLSIYFLGGHMRI